MPRLTHLMLRYSLVLGCLGAVFTATAQEAPAHGAHAAPMGAEAPFVKENNDAMKHMMTGMDAKPTGDVDRDFVTMMSAHHRGAIDMAQAYLKYGHNERLKAMAQKIIADQQREIAEMAAAVGEPSPTAPGPATKKPAPAP